MLTNLRRYSRHGLMLATFVGIVFTFVFTFNTTGQNSGCGGSSGPETSGTLAQVGSHDISVKELRAAERMSPEQPRDFVDLLQYQSRRFLFTEPFRPDIESLPATAFEKVTSDLVESHLVGQVASEMGLYASDRELADFVRKGFFTDRDFDRDEYRNIVANGYGLSVAEFEEFIRRELARRKVAQVVTASVTADPATVDYYFGQMYDRVVLRVATLVPARLAALVEVSDADASKYAGENAAEIEKYFNEHAAEFKKPERATFEGIFKKAPFQKQIELETDATKKAELETKRAAASAAILASVDKLKAAAPPAEAPPAKAPDAEPTDAEPSDVGAADEAPAAPADKFAEVAKSDSDHSPSASKNGVNAEISKEALKSYPYGEAVQKAVFDLEPGQLSEVLETDAGFWVIRVKERFQPEEKTLEQAKSQIARKLLQKERAKEKVDKVGTELIAAMKKDPKRPLDEVVKEWNASHAAGEEGEMVVASSTNPFGRMSEGSIPRTTATSGDIPGVGHSQELVEAAFALSAESPVADKVFALKDQDTKVVAQFQESSALSDEEKKDKREGVRTQLDNWLKVQTYLAWYRHLLQTKLDNDEVEYSSTYRDLLAEAKKNALPLPKLPEGLPISL